MPPNNSINKNVWRRWAIKFFVVIAVVIIAIDTAPIALVPGTGPLAFIYDLKSAIRPILRPLGVWQAEWRLFAPDPVVSNTWWTIEVNGPLASELEVEPGQISSLSWNTPFWGEVGPVEKFFKRRHIAYFRRLSDFPLSVGKDYADFWVRERFGDRLRPLEDSVVNEQADEAGPDTRPVLLELSLYRNELKLAFPDDGLLPTRDETVWLSVTEKFLQRKYGP